ncbi:MULTISPECIES: DUF6114 domain-containing protein [unclassified Streptomyces]|uniref:DUF6114 domain-containing protein n=1 Tax=unclassified Streptomyces TaxID=2593676 RepID=UPI00081F5D5F|nr:MULTISPECIES: DUF6114 domain-containing protein [unclassified Streptomyces]MYZ37698.1 hypothetical protein [Streptomyces sp. SID4917]SCF93391.1 hypothetical protein GA0115259_105113 [Streptomyces sp. MnatMP-M17]
MSGESSGPRGRFTYWRLRFRAWRGTRPFWAGLFTLLSGAPIAYFPYANLRLGHLTLAMATTAGAGSLIIGVLLVTLGLTMWFHSIVRVFAGVATILLALVSLPVSNIGGFLIGFVLALLGGALSVSWAPGKPPRPAAEHHIPHQAPEPGRAEPGWAGTGRAEPDRAAPDRAGDPFPVPRDGEDPNVTETTAQANGGRNSAG